MKIKYMAALLGRASGLLINNIVLKYHNITFFLIFNIT